MNDIVEAFFYGLYMDPELIKSLGFEPQSVEKAVIDSYALDLQGSAKIVPEEGSIVWGNIIKLSKNDLAAMYSFDTTKDYSPEMVQVKDSNGNYKMVSCYNLSVSDAEAFNSEYRDKLVNLLKQLDFPDDYITRLELLGESSS